MIVKNLVSPRKAISKIKFHNKVRGPLHKKFLILAILNLMQYIPSFKKMHSACKQELAIVVVNRVGIRNHSYIT